VHSLNILVKYVRLYGFDHKRTETQFQTTWNELQNGLPTTGESGFLLGVSGQQLLLDGSPLETGQAERSFAQLLTTAGLAGCSEDEPQDTVTAFLNGWKSGDLSKVNQPIIKQDIKPGTDQLVSLRKAIEILEQLKSGGILSSKDLQILASTNQQLSLRASAEPRIYLAALSAMRRILSDWVHIKSDDITRVEKAIQKTLTPAEKMPVAAQNPVDMGLSQEYYKNLNQLNR